MKQDAVAFYLNSAGKIPLLTPVEEIELGRKVQRFMALLEEKPEGPYDLQEKRVLRQGQRAKDRMILANLRLVTILAKKYAPRCRHMAMEDLLQEGVVGLIRGVEKFDPEKGYKFSTYAYWWIRQGVARAVSTSDRMIKLPSNAMDCLNKARYFIPRFQGEHGRLPTVEEIAEECGVTPLAMGNYLKHSLDASSLDAQCQGNNDGEGSYVIDMVADLEGITPWEYTEREHMGEYYAAVHQAVQQAVHSLAPVLQKVVQLRFSLTKEDGGDFFPLTQTETAKRLGISRQAVAQRERKAINSLMYKLNCVA